MFFRYFKGAEGTQVEDNYIRVPSSDADFYVDQKEEDGSDRYVELAFLEWWDEAHDDDERAQLTNGADEGEFWAEMPDPNNPGSIVTIACSMTTGEPIDAPVEE